MAQIELRLSSKTQKETGLSEILIRLYHSRELNIRAKSGIWVSPDHFEYYIDRRKTSQLGTVVPANTITATKKCAEKNGYILYDRGTIEVRNRLETEDKKYHDEQKEKLNKLQAFIISSYSASSNEVVTSEWLETIIDKFHHPDKYVIKPKGKPSFFDCMVDFRDNAKKKVNGRREGEKSEVWKKNFNVLVRALMRYELFVRSTDKSNNGFKLDIDTLDTERLEDIEDYLRNEHELLNEYPIIYKQIPARTDSKRKSPKPQPRGNNTICALFNKLRAFYNWLNEQKMTANNPFVGFVGTTTEHYGTPIYITLEERNHIADFDLSQHPALEVQRDIFIFQCCIGCRVSDLLRLTDSNVINGAIEYIPTKTKAEQQKAVRVPLNKRAYELLCKYHGKTKCASLFPFITAQKYNEAIKRIFTVCGITRLVTVLDGVTGKEVQRPINEIASSHMARRCFVGNLYKQVKDPNLIAPMSGHAEGSKAFNRYREIDEEMKRELVSLIN